MVHAFTDTRDAAQADTSVWRRLQTLRQLHAYPHIIAHAGLWYPAERVIGAATAVEWLTGGTALAAALSSTPGAAAIDLTALTAGAIAECLPGVVAAYGLGDFARRNVLQFTVAQANALADDERLRRLPCHIVVQRRDLPGLKSQLAVWPARWVPLFARRLESTSAVLGAESFACATPVNRLCLPGDAAVLPVSLNMLPYWSRRGFDAAGLDAALAVVLAEADELLDELRWPLASDVWDVYRHRRLALLPRGLGELIQLAGCGGDDHAAAAFAEAALTGLANAARRHSRRLADCSGPCAALEPEHALGHLLRRPDYPEWRRRWLAATDAQRYRHRNLTFACLADFWPGQSLASRPAAWCAAIAAVDGTGYGRRWGAIAARLSEKPAFGALAASLTRDGSVASGPRLR
ncbi:MAG: hypothetical protein AAFX44_03135 [Pseudomonadota bacterium]